MSHRSEIARSETIDDRPGGGAERRQPWRVGDRHPSRHHHALEERIEQDDNEAALECIVANHVGRNGFGASGRGGRRGRQFNRRERDDLAWLAVFENREIKRRQPANRASLPIENGHVELNGVDAGAEGGRLCRWELLSGRIADEHGEPAHEQADGCFHEYSSLRLAAGSYLLFVQ